MKPEVTGSLLVESAPGRTYADTALTARDLARQFPLVSVTMRHNDTDVRAFADDTIAGVCRRWAEARGENR